MSARSPRAAAHRARLARLLARRLQMGRPPAAFPLSVGQQDLWLAHRNAPASAAWNVPLILRFGGPLDLSALSWALDELLYRHRVLRTIYSVAGGTPRQRVLTGQPLPITVADAAAWSDGQLAADLDDKIGRPIDLARGPAFRLRVLRRGRAGDVVLVLAHCIAVDRTSYWTVLDELLRLYQAAVHGRDLRLPPVAQYHQYVQWEREQLAGRAGERAREYWRRQLNGAQLTRLGPSVSAAADSIGDIGATVPFTLDGELTSRLRDVTRRLETTLDTVLLAAFQLLLHQYSGASDILVSSLADDRSRLGPGYQGMVGYCTRQIPLRSRLRGSPEFAAYLRDVQQTVLDGFSHPAAPLAEMVRPLGRDVGIDALAIDQPQFTMTPRRPGSELPAEEARRESDAVGAVASGGAPLSLGGMSMHALRPPPRASRHSLAMEIGETRDRLGGVLNFRREAFRSSTIERMASRYQRLLERIASAPGARVADLQPRSERERA